MKAVKTSMISGVSLGLSVAAWVILVSRCAPDPGEIASKVLEGAVNCRATIELPKFALYGEDGDVIDVKVRLYDCVREVEEKIE